MCLISADKLLKRLLPINHPTEEFKLSPPMTKKNLGLKILKIPSGYCDITLKLVHLITEVLMLWCALQQ